MQVLFYPDPYKSYPDWKHGEEHAYGGEDELPSGSISGDMIIDGVVTSSKLAGKSKYISNSIATGVAIGVNGSPVEIVSVSVEDGFSNMIPLVAKGTPSGLGTAEDCIYHLVAALDNGTFVTLATKSGTSEVAMTIADCDFSVIGSGKRIISLSLTAESSATTTAATSVGSVVGIEIYV